MSNLNRDEISEKLIRTIADVVSKDKGLTIEDRLKSVGLSVKQVVDYNNDLIETKRKELTDTELELIEKALKPIKKMVQANATKDNRKYHRPFLKEVGRKLKSFEEE
tara:strand:+ start:5003 stop:5323 length:321 start_codon:yes stop_codon:yes gene_type:complete